MVFLKLQMTLKKKDSGNSKKNQTSSWHIICQVLEYACTGTKPKDIAMTLKASQEHQKEPKGIPKMSGSQSGSC